MKSCDDVIEFLTDAARLVVGDTFTEQHAQAIEARLRIQYGGQEIYVRKLDRNARCAIVQREFNGRNRKELCTKHQLSRSQFYRLVKKR